MTKIAFIGTGVMGGPMASHLAKAGHDVTVYNRTREKAEKWAAIHGGTVADSPQEAARDLLTGLGVADLDPSRVG